MKYLFFVVLIASYTTALPFDSIKVYPDDHQLDLSGLTYVYSDTTNQLSAQDITDLSATSWTKKNLKGYSSYNEWILIPMQNATSEAFDKILYLANPITHIVDFHFAINGTLLPDSILSGLARPSSTKFFSDPSYPVKIHFPANATVTALVRIKDDLSSISVPFYILDLKKALVIKDQNLAFSFFWLGLVALSLLISIMLYISLRQKMFLYYSFFALAMIIIVTSTTGLIYLAIDLDPFQIVTNYYQIGAVLMINFFPKFINTIVPIKPISILAWRGIKGLGMLTVTIAILYCTPYFKFSFLFTSLFIKTVVISSGVVFLYLLVVLLIAIFRKQPRALPLFLVYFIYLSIGFSNVILPLLGFENKGLNAIHFVLIGSMFETIAFMVFMTDVTLSVYRERESLNIKVQENQELIMKAIVTGQEEERNRFAQDLHDGFGQMISTLMLNIKGLQSNQAAKPEERESIFDSSSHILKEMYVELKNICFNLMPQTLIAAGVGEALKEFASRINKSGKVHASVDLFGMEKRLSDIQEISLYRIAQEWVNNILKYSNATKISIQITRDEEEITLMIEDNGAGFDVSLLAQGKGNGWKNIHSRAKLIRGEIDVDSTPEIMGSALILNAPVNIENQVKKIISLGNRK